MRTLTLAPPALILALVSCDYSCGIVKAPYVEPPAASYMATIIATSVNGQEETVSAARVSPEFFKAAQAPPLLGRLFIIDEHKPGGTAVVVISYEFWKSRFASDPSMIGRRIQVDGRNAVVIAVMPPKFDFPQHASLWVPDVR